MSNHKSFVFHATKENQELVLPPKGKYHLYINRNGQLEVIDCDGDIIRQQSGVTGEITSDAVLDNSTYGGSNVTEVIDAIIEAINGIQIPASVQSVNGQNGEVTIGISDLNMEDFFIFSINNDINNGVYRGSGNTYTRVDVGDHLGSTFSRSLGVWTVSQPGGTNYQSLGSQNSTPPWEVTYWETTNQQPVTFASATVYSSTTTQSTIEEVAKRSQKANNLSVMDVTYSSHIERIFTASTTSGNWEVHMTDDYTAIGNPFYQSILLAQPSSTGNTVATMGTYNNITMSGSCYSMPSATNAPNGTMVRIFVKGIES